MSKEKVRVVCALLQKNGEILACQRSQSMSHAGKWELPGGKVEIEELADAAIIREIKEELQLDIKILKKLDDCVFEYSHAIVRLIPFEAYALDWNKLHLEEHQAYKWVHKENYRQLDWLPADLPILESYFDTGE